MSSESHKPARVPGELPRHADVSYEERDIKTGSIYWYLFALGLATAAALVISLIILHVTTNLAASSDTPPPPSRQALGKDYQSLPPEPRLQGVPGHPTDPQKDLREKRAADKAENEKLRWIDKNAGIAQIPVEDAMKIIAEKGLSLAYPPPAERKK